MYVYKALAIFDVDNNKGSKRTLSKKGKKKEKKKIKENLARIRQHDCYRSASRSS